MNDKPHIQMYRSAGRAVYVLYTSMHDWRVLAVGFSVRELSQRVAAGDAYPAHAGAKSFFMEVFGLLRK